MAAHTKNVLCIMSSGLMIYAIAQNKVVLEITDHQFCDTTVLITLNLFRMRTEAVDCRSIDH